jgi:hypothetical protein
MPFGLHRSRQRVQLRVRADRLAVRESDITIAPGPAWNGSAAASRLLHHPFVLGDRSRPSGANKAQEGNANSGSHSGNAL